MKIFKIYSEQEVLIFLSFWNFLNIKGLYSLKKLIKIIFFFYEKKKKNLIPMDLSKINFFLIPLYFENFFSYFLIKNLNFDKKLKRKYLKKKSNLENSFLKKKINYFFFFFFI